jgi:hypothetical protein
MELVQAATASIDKQIVELIQAETDWLASYGFPREATAVTRLAVSLKAGINADAFNHGKEAILTHPRAEVTPQLTLANLQVLFQD